MRILALAIAMALAVGATPSSVLSQEQRKDGGSGTVKGQSEHPTNPKQAEPESSSHNADKPKKTEQPPPSASPKPDPKKK